jgi:hypothetical protein
MTGSQWTCSPPTLGRFQGPAWLRSFRYRNSWLKRSMQVQGYTLLQVPGASMAQELQVEGTWLKSSRYRAELYSMLGRFQGTAWLRL